LRDAAEIAAIQVRTKERPTMATAKKPRTDGVHAKVKPSSELAEIVGKEPLARTEIVSKMWEYIKKHKLQNPDDGREILADDKLGKLFGKKKVSMFELNKIISANVS
jgi:upstream activation factor subunit UAF30